MAMSMKEKILTVWVVMFASLSFVINHFWASTIFLYGRAVALNLVGLKGLTKLAAAICGVHLLP
jgi:hypothetical protein